MEIKRENHTPQETSNHSEKSEKREKIKNKRLQVLSKNSKERSEIKKQLPEKASNNFKDFLNSKGEVAVEKVEKFKQTIDPGILSRLNQKKPGLIREIFTTPNQGPKWQFKCWGNSKVQKRISLVEVLWGKFLPEVKVNNHLAKASGPGGPYFYENPAGYAAIVEGTQIEELAQTKSVEEVKKLQTEINKPLNKKEKTEIEEIIEKTKSKKENSNNKIIETLQLQSENSDYLKQQIVLASRIQKVPLQSLLEVISNQNYPKGFYSIRANWQPESIIFCSARGLKINEKRYLEMGLNPFEKDGSYNSNFLFFSKNNYLPSNLKPKKIGKFSLNSKSFSSIKNRETVFLNASDLAPSLQKAIQESGPSYRKNPAIKAVGKNGIDTFQVEKNKLNDKYEIPSNGLFAGTILSSSKPLPEMKGQKANLILFAHGTAGFNSPGRYKSAMNNLGLRGENHITAAPEDAVPSRLHQGKKYHGYPYYSWNNLAATDGRPKFITYFSNLVSALEKNGPKITSLSMAGHSGGGFFLEKILDYFPTGEIPYKNPETGESRNIRINLLFDADSQYYGPQAAAFGYFSNSFYKAIKDNINSNSFNDKQELKRTLEKICLPISQDFLQKISANYQASEGGVKARINLPAMCKRIANQIIENYSNKILDGSFNSYKPPHYFSSYTAQGWKHQRAMQKTMAQISQKSPAISSVETDGHGKAFSHYFEQALTKRS